MAMSTLDKGGRELAAAWLRRGGAPLTDTHAKARQRPIGSDARLPVATHETGAIFHSDTHVSFSRA